MLTADLDEESLGWCHQLGQLQDRRRLLEAEEDVLKGKIGAHLGQAAEGRYDGSPVVTWRCTSRVLVDVERLRTARPDVAINYRKTSTYRSLRLVNRKGDG